MVINRDRLVQMTMAYSAEHSAYKNYASFLRLVLEEASRRWAPGSFVEARAKTLASFAEKVVRKQAKFDADPKYDLTDRCGARVVAPSSVEVATLCSFVERNFIVDEANSLRHEEHLKVNEFGYRSIHYIVQIRDADEKLLGIAVPLDSRRGPDGFEAEIQVRTVAEHVLASGLHDRIYKTSITVPVALMRENARLSATLESVDGRFTTLSSGIDAYLGFYHAYLDSAGIERELAILRAARECDPAPASKIKLSLKIAALSQARGKWNEARQELEAAGQLGPPSAELLIELAHVLCQSVGCNPRSPEFLRAVEMLTSFLNAAHDAREPETAQSRAIRAQAAFRLGWCLGLERYREDEAARYFRLAWELERTNPYFLASYLEFEIATSPRELARMMEPMLREAIAACQRHVEVGIEIPRACFTAARLHLLLGETGPSLNAYAAGVALVLKPESVSDDRCFDDELEFLRRVSVKHSGEKERPLIDAAQTALSIARKLKNPVHTLPTARAAQADQRIASIRARREPGILIVAGGAKGLAAVEIAQYETIVGRAIKAGPGVVLYGGTTVGIPGLAGKVAAKVAPKGQRAFLLFGYRAKSAAMGTSPDDDNADNIGVSNSERSSPNEPLNGWIELIAAGASPNDVVILCINGGDIAAFEMRFALALGARVGVVVKSGRMADQILADPVWKDHPRLIPLPSSGIDDATMRAFVRRSRFDLTAEELDRLAQAVHARYLKCNLHADSDYSPERRHWKDLREDLKNSNREQVLYAAEVLASEGYRLVKRVSGDAPAPTPQYSEAELERMAEKEHGRWCFERLAARWVSGDTGFKDAINRINPSIKPYVDLQNETKHFDREAICNYANIFAAADYDIVRSAKAPA
jgi:ppGpp synthetase/RelA/SpoT-type nucleotidyltranferase